MWDVQMGDFNGDGKTDFIRIAPEYCHTFISLGREGNNFAFKPGTFMYPTTWDFSTAVGKKSDWATIVGDFNADGVDDWAKVGAQHMKLFLSKENLDPFEAGNSMSNKALFETSTWWYPGANTDGTGSNFGNDLNTWGIAVGNWEGITGDKAKPELKVDTDTRLDAASGFHGGCGVLEWAADPWACGFRGGCAI